MPSSVIREIHYDPETKSLEVHFVSGLIYVYHDVPQPIYAAFLSFREKGVYFNRHIKDKYRFTKLLETKT